VQAFNIRHGLDWLPGTPPLLIGHRIVFLIYYLVYDLQCLIYNIEMERTMNTLPKRKMEI
jgi:hypothetical protein